MTLQQEIDVRRFGENFEATMKWAVDTGAVKPQDVGRIRATITDTVYAATIYAAIARSLP